MRGQILIYAIKGINPDLTPYFFIEVAELLLATSNWGKLKNCTWVPMPPSQIKIDENYDDRLLRSLQVVKKRSNL